MVDFVSPLIVLGFSVLRAVAGWVQKALEDNKISKVEWKMLLITLIRNVIYTAAGYYGLNLDIASASALGVGIDVIRNEFFDRKKD